MTDINHNHGNDTGNGNQSDGGSEDDLERPGLLYGGDLHYIRVFDVDEGVRIEAIPREDCGDRDRPQITIPHSLLPDDYPWRDRR